MAITLNPGFALLLGAALALAAPFALRAPLMAGAAVASIALMFAPDFGEAAGIAQVGLELVPARLDPLSQVFGLALSLAALVLALFSGVRRNRAEDLALMAYAGGAVSAVFAGDLVSFVAAAQFSALAGVALVSVGPGAGAAAAGRALLAWQGMAGGLLAAGAGLVWAETYDVTFARLSVETPAGLVFFLGVLIMAGAPLAHVWLTQAGSEASTIGGAAIGVFTLKLGLYALARAYAGEPSLLWLGIVLALAPLALAAVCADMRRCVLYGALSQSGMAMGAIAAGAPLAVAAAAAYAFAATLHTLLALLALGLARERTGAGPAGSLGGLCRTMPLTATMAVAAGLSALAAPGLAGFSASALLRDAVAQTDKPLLFYAIVAAGAGAALHAGGRAPYQVFFGRDRGLRPREAPFGALLAMALTAFFCAALGLHPDWLYRLLPDEIAFDPYDSDPLLAQAQLAAFALLAFATLVFFRLLPGDKRAAPREIADLDALYGGPLQRVVGAAGAALARAHAGYERLLAKAQAWLARATAEAAARVESPGAPDFLGPAWTLLALAVLLVILYSFQG